MGFYNSDEKIRYNVTYNAYSVICDDMLTFGEKKFSSFIQRIFMNFKDDSEASISLALLKERAECDRVLSPLSLTVFPQSNRDVVAKAFINSTRDRLVAKYCALSRDVPMSLRPRNDVYGYLCSEECGEDKYYKNAGAYIQAVAENYASLPFRDRELIYCKPTYEKVIFSLSTPHRAVRIKSTKNILYDFLPLGIRKDSLGMSNYLIGYIRTGTEKRAVSFKLSRIKEYNLTNNLYPSKERKNDLKSIEEELSKEDLPFLIGDNEQITVEFTDEGMLNYKKWQYNRPDSVKAEGNVIVFDCSRYQAMAYLARFGNTAKVISPADFAGEIRSFFEAALSQY